MVSDAPASKAATDPAPGRSPSRPTPDGTGPDRSASVRRGGLAIGSTAYRFLLPLVTAAAVVGFWQWVVDYFEVRPILTPAPLAIWQMLLDQRELLLERSWETIFETAVGFGIGAVAGLVLAVLLASFAVVERASLPLIIALNAIPKVAVAPLLVIWLSFGHPPKITLAATICFFPIMIAAMAGLRSTPVDLYELAQVHSASWWKTFTKIRVPHAMPQVFVGLKLGVTLAVIGTVVAQLAHPDTGLGATIYHSGSAANTTLAFAAIVLLMVINLGMFYSVVALERFSLPWARETTAGRA